MPIGLIAALAAFSGAMSATSEPPQPARAAACEVDTSAMLKLSPDQFDQDLNGGWRTLGHQPGCELAAADLIAAYRKAHWGALTSSELHTSYWHEGQGRAMAGRYAEAVPLLMAGVDPKDVGDREDYALGTIAFLDHDLAALKAARARLAKTPEPPDWSEAVARYKGQGRELKWPMNLDILDGLIRCFDKPYREAYGSAECQASDR